MKDSVCDKIWIMAIVLYCGMNENVKSIWGAEGQYWSVKNNIKKKNSVEKKKKKSQINILTQICWGEPELSRLHSPPTCPLMKLQFSEHCSRLRKMSKRYKKYSFIDKTYFSFSLICCSSGTPVNLWSSHWLAPAFSSCGFWPRLPARAAAG